jgi:oxygen-independent coproporphyrinogen-3 oxidase
MQSARAEQLMLYERQHTMQMVEDAVTSARQTGWANISLDLIYGAPGETLPDWKQTVDRALVLKPDHISMYGLTLEGNTPLKDAVDAGILPNLDDDLLADMYELGSKKLASGGLQQYEISNWAVPGYESRHNLQYWRNQPYLGLGPGAHGYAGDVRYIVMRWPEKYIQTLSDNPQPLSFPKTPAVSKAVPVDRETEISETLMMGLRLTQEGIQRSAFRARFGVDVVDLHAATIKKYVDYDMMHCDDEVLRLTKAGRLVSNVIISEFI